MRRIDFEQRRNAGYLHFLFAFDAERTFRAIRDSPSFKDHSPIKAGLDAVTDRYCRQATSLYSPSMSPTAIMPTIFLTLTAIPRWPIPAGRDLLFNNRRGCAARFARRRVKLCLKKEGVGISARMISSMKLSHSSLRIRILNKHALRNDVTQMWRQNRA